MRRVALSIIAVIQFLAALLFFATLDTTLKATPFNTLTLEQSLFLAWPILIYLLGLIGSLLLWAARRTGLALSLLHQVTLVPLIIVPNSFFYVLGDVVSVALTLARTNEADRFVFAFNIGTNSLLATLNPQAGTGYYGVNLFALLCAVYLLKVRRA